MDTRLLALDMGGTRLKWAIVENGHILQQGVQPSSYGEQEVTSQIAKLVQEHQLPYALGIAGDIKDGIVAGAEHLGLANYSPEQYLRALGLSAPTVCINDATAACAGEVQGSDSLAYVSVGTGVGGKVFINGKIATGKYGAAGEIGHVVFKNEGKPCLCGLRGCAELYAGWKGIQWEWNQVSPFPLNSPRALLELTDKDDHAAQVMNTALDAIAFACNSLIVGTEPEKLVLGGGITAAWGESMRDGVERRLRVLSTAGMNIDIQASTLGEQAALLGLYSVFTEQIAVA